jgi:uncharacterized protein
MLDNTAIVRRGFEAWNAGDADVLAGLLDEDAAWHTPGMSVLAGDAVGRDAVVAHVGRFADASGGTFETRLQRLLTDEEGRVLGIHRTLAMRRGRRLDIYGCIVFELAGGRILAACEHVVDLHAWDAFWS